MHNDNNSPAVIEFVIIDGRWHAISDGVSVVDAATLPALMELAYPSGY